VSIAQSTTFAATGFKVTATNDIGSATTAAFNVTACLTPIVTSFYYYPQSIDVSGGILAVGEATVTNIAQSGAVTWTVSPSNAGVSFDGAQLIYAKNTVLPTTTYTLTAKNAANVSSSGGGDILVYNTYIPLRTSGTFVSPFTGTYNILLVGGGGGGGTNGTYPQGGGGGGGGISATTVSLNNGTSYTYTIGNGGATGAVGGTTTFQGGFSAVGGNPGLGTGVGGPAGAGNPSGTGGLAPGNLGGVGYAPAVNPTGITQAGANLAGGGQAGQPSSQIMRSGGGKGAIANNINTPNVSAVAGVANSGGGGGGGAYTFKTPALTGSAGGSGLILIYKN
jgi:hypothetical protein